MSKVESIGNKADNLEPPKDPAENNDQDDHSYEHRGNARTLQGLDRQFRGAEDQTHGPGI